MHLPFLLCRKLLLQVFLHDFRLNMLGYNRKHISITARIIDLISLGEVMIVMSADILGR